MSKRIAIGILFGGKSAEHEISLLSARNIIEALDPQKYDIVPIFIDKGGQWHLTHTQALLERAVEPCQSKDLVALLPHAEKQQLMSLTQKNQSRSLDVVFPIIHGSHGEDGTIQGLLKLANIPFVGAGVLGSAVGMDKDVMKRLLRDAAIPIARFLAFHETGCPPFQEVAAAMGLPFFVKPANTGSSVGICKVKQEADWKGALEAAFSYDRKVIVEEYIPGREIECSVLGNENPIASLPGEVIPQHEFYSYEAKYLDPEGAHFKVPAELDLSVIERIQTLAVQTYQALCCEGMGRVDFFLRPDGMLFVNEINTIPGFTSISMYPKMWEASGIGYGQLLDQLIELALKRSSREEQIRYDRITPEM